MQPLDMIRRKSGVLCLGVWLSMSVLISAQPSNPGTPGISPDIELKPPNGSFIAGLNATCPSNMTVNAQPGINGAVVNWAAIPVTTDCATCTTAMPQSTYLGHYNGHQYFQSMALTDWVGATQFALSQQSHLVAINTPGENAFLEGSMSVNVAYTSGNDLSVEGLFEWANGDPFVYTNWAQGQPDNANNNEDVIGLAIDGTWRDVDQNNARPFLVELPCVTAQLIAGLPNGSIFPIGTTTVTYKIVDACGNTMLCSFLVTVLNPISVQCPNDITVSCQPGKNGATVNWSLPTATTSCTSCNQVIPQTVDMGSFNGSHYYCTVGTWLWADAQNYASSYGGHLMAVNSQAENNFIASKLTLQEAYIGLSDLIVEGQFLWVNGDPLVYTSWAPGQPVNQTGSEDVVGLSPAGTWKTINKYLKKECVIEVPCLTITQIVGLPPGSDFPVGTTKITYKITDACGNEAFCSFYVTVKEGVSITCPNDITVDCQSGKNGAHVSWPLPQAYSCCTQCVNGAPIPGFIYMGSDQGSKYYCSLQPATWASAKAQSELNGGHLAIISGISENTFIASKLMGQNAWIGLTDAASEGFFQWVDNSPLTFNNWQAGQPNNGNGSNEDHVMLRPDGFWTDENGNAPKEFVMEIPCVTIEQISGPTPGALFPVGTTTVVYKVTDGCNNTATCSFKVTVKACCNDAPSITCPPDFIGCPETSMSPGTTGYPTSNTLNGSCGQVMFDYTDLVLSQGNCWDKKIKRTWKAYFSQNPSQYTTCDQIIELKDVKAPVIWECPKDITVEPGPDCQVCVGWTPPNAMDNCSNVTVTSSHSPGAWFGAGTTTVTYTFTDACGNKSYCSFKITVNPCCEPPSVQCPPKFVGCPETSMSPNITGFASASAQENGCGKVNLEYWDTVISTGNCWSKTIKRTWKAFYQDHPSLYTTCEQIIELKDVTPPVVWECPKDITVQPDANCHACVFWTPPNAMDNCSSVTVSVSHLPGATFGEGTTTVVYTFTDACGNQSTCAFDVTVTPCCQAPDIQCPSNYNACPDTPILPTLTGFPTSISQDGPCGIVEFEYQDQILSMGTCWDKTIQRTWKATYSLDAGLKSECLQIIELKDIQAPQFILVPNDLTLCPNDPISFATPTVSDNCSNVNLSFTDSWIWGDCKTGEQVLRTWTATDDCGNQSTATQSLILKDNQFPVVYNCPVDITADPGNDCKATVSWSKPTATDNCGAVTVTASHNPGDIFPEGVTTVTYVFTDACGNISQCKFKVTVSACCAPPDLVCPAKYVGCPGDYIGPDATGEPTLVGPSNCGLMDLTYTEFVTDTSGCPGSIALGRVWTLTVVGQPEKKSTCEQWIILEDKSAPVFVPCPADIEVYTDTWCPVQVFWPEPEITDLCSDFSVEVTHLNGDTYFPGSYDVQYWAEDDCGNVSFCFFNIQVNYLSNPPLCISHGEDASAIWVEDYTLNGVQYINGNNCGWGAKDAWDQLLPWGSKVDLMVNPGYSGAPMPYYLRVWLDLNRDGDFLDFGEMMYDAKALGQGPANIQFTVPEFAMAGLTWMRISCKYTDLGDDSTLPEACSIFQQGEVEDVQVQLGTTTALTDPGATHQVKLFPNPAHGQVQLMGTDLWESLRSVEIYNAIGLRVHREENIATGTSPMLLDIGELPSGFYQVLISNANGKKVALPLIID
jgi:hypothetical protein